MNSISPSRVVIIDAFSTNSTMLTFSCLLVACYCMQRILMFHYNGPDCNANPGACPEGLHQYYTYASDNNWSHDSVASIEDRTSSCELRPNGVNNNIFVGLNNFVSPPSQTSAQKLNSYSAVSNYVDTCSALLGTDINFVLVDFWSEGEIPRFTQDHNNARALQRRGRKLLRTEPVQGQFV